MRTSEARAVVERYIDEVLSGRGPATAAELISSETFRQRVESFRSAFPDAVVEPDLIVAEGAFVAVHARGRGTHRGIFQGAPPTGRTWSATCSALYRVEAGRIADFYVNWDLLTILEQLGAVRRRDGTSA